MMLRIKVDSDKELTNAKRVSECDEGGMGKQTVRQIRQENMISLFEAGMFLDHFLCLVL